MPQSSLKRIMIVTAAAGVAGLYLRHAVKPVATAFRTGRALGLAERDEDIRVLIHGVADAVRMLDDKTQEASDGTEDRRGDADRPPRVGERVEGGAPGAAAAVPPGTA